MVAFWAMAARTNSSCAPRGPRSQRGLAEQRLGDTRLQALRDRDDLVGGFKRARPNQHGDFAAFVQNVSGRPEQALFEKFRRAGVTDTGMGRAWASGGSL